MRRFLGATGRVLITAGILLLLFVAYQLWGTGIYEARAQDQLKSQFEQLLGRTSRTASTTTSTTVPVATTAPPTTLVPLVAAPANGEPMGQIDIPKIGVSKIVVQGVDVGDLRKGPGHYPATPFPGQEGNTSIAGHRTTYGAPFGNLDQLVEGDEIDVRTVQGSFTYKVEKTLIVSPNDGYVLLPEADPARPGHNRAMLTLTTCHPKYQAAQRLVVKAVLALPIGKVALPPTRASSRAAPTTFGGLSGERSSRLPALLWGIVVAVVGLLWWLPFHRHPRWFTWFAGAIPFLAALFVFYVYVERMLPSNY
jgi:sortase A